MKIFKVTPALVCFFVCYSCSLDDKLSEAENNEFEKVRSITTTFESHQDDTSEKNNRTVAEAVFDADGNVARVTQFMSYPYNYKEPFEEELWTNPLPENVPNIMDGLTLGESEKNFLYGNDWPKAYMDFINSKGHPKYSKGYEGLNSYKSEFKFSESTLPEEINTRQQNQNSSGIEFGYSERFEYADDKIINYAFRHEIKDHTGSDSPFRLISSAENPYVKNEFIYEGDLLIQVNESNRRMYKFYYNELEELIKSEFYVTNKLRSIRNYFYGDSGLREKTEIINTNGDLEYTIHYHYEFYE